MAKEDLRKLSAEYRELNGSHIEVLDAPPSALEFLRLVRIGRPVIIKGHNIPANSARWTDQYLVEKMGNQPISVAMTPNGFADAVVAGVDGHRYFTEPAVAQITMNQLLSNLQRSDTENEICYLQSQNGNVYSANYFDAITDIENASASEFENLRCDIPPEIPWCSEALYSKPDAVNVWIGSGESVTSVHSDPYENIYHVVRGQKNFTLLPPTDGWAMKERLYRHAAYKRNALSGKLELEPSEAETPLVRWSSISNPREAGMLPEEVQPLYVSISAGDTLYLPAGWWHYVEQSRDEPTIALNWWYDMEMRGMSWVILHFLRGEAEPVESDEM